MQPRHFFCASEENARAPSAEAAGCACIDQSRRNVSEALLEEDRFVLPVAQALVAWHLEPPRHVCEVPEPVGTVLVERRRIVFHRSASA